MWRSSTTTVSGLSSTAVAPPAAADASLAAIALLRCPEDDERNAQEHRGPQHSGCPHERTGVVAAQQRLPHQCDVDVERVDLHEDEEDVVRAELVDVVEDPGEVEHQPRDERDQLREV